MKIKYLGHACFSVTSDDYTIVLDPYKGVRGFKDIDMECNEAICSHSHFDHCYTDKLNINKKDSPFIVKSIASYHDDCKSNKRGNNNITVLMAEGKRVVHLGDLGHLLDKDTINELKDCDLLMIPIGGFYTIDANEAMEIIEDLNPKKVAPMHYKDGNLGLEAISDIEEFLNKAEKIKDRLVLVKEYGKEIEI